MHLLLVVILSVFAQEEDIIVANLPVIIDGKANETLLIKAGDDWRASLQALRQRHERLSLEHELVLENAIVMRAHKAGWALQHRWFILICSGQGSSSQLSVTLNSIPHHALRPGYRIALILDGFSLSNKHAFTGIQIVESKEWEGLTSCFNRAIHLLPPHAIAVIAYWGTRFRHEDQEDLFIAYERLARGYDRQGRLVATATLNNLEAPVIILDTATASRLGQLDHGFMFAPGLAAWLMNGRNVTVLDPLPWPSRFFDNYQNHQILTAHGYPPSHETERLQQLDADLFHLLATEKPSPIPPWYPQRPLTSLSTERKLQDKHRVAAMPCLYDETRFVHALLNDLSPRVDAVLILQATRPWYGEPRPISHAMEFLAQVSATDPKISLVRGEWRSEEDQRNAGLALARLLPLAISHVLLVDGDEFWHPVELDRALALIAKRELANQTVGYARAAMTTYWKSSRIVVHPPEPLRILWLVSLGPLPKELEYCHFSEARNWACVAAISNEISAESTHAIMDALGAYLDESTARCHHLSYVRTTSELELKLASFAHAKDVRDGWLDKIWLRWEKEQNLTNLHPTHPSAFAGTRHQPLWALPPALRRLFLDAIKLGKTDHELYTRRHYAEANKDNTLILLDDDELIINAPFKKHYYIDTIDSKNHNCSSTASYRDVKYTSHSHRHYESSVPMSSITDYIGIDEPGGPRCHNGQPRFIILVVGEGHLDTSTQGIFTDTANILAHTLIDMGAANAAVQWCPDLRFCMRRGEALLIVLGIQHLARYWFHSNVSNSSMIEQMGWPNPETSILYNFEQAEYAQDLAPHSQFWTLLRRWALVGNLWDYSAANVLRLAAEPYFLRAQHVPLGYHKWLESEYELDKHRDIDILFVGRIEGSASRRATLKALREDAQLNILHGNSEEPVFGKQLSQLLVRSKIVLSLRFWSNEDEWKMTRYLPALSHEALVISESNGADVEQRAWADAIVFVKPGPELIDTCRYYLHNHTARRLRAAAGRKILQQRPAAYALINPISQFVRNLCPNASFPVSKTSTVNASSSLSDRQMPWQFQLASSSSV